MKKAVFSFAFLLLAAGTPAQLSPTAAVDRVVTHPRVRSAEQFLDTDHERIISETILLTEIPAPPFKEAERAKAFMQMLKESGLSNAEIDAEGNVVALRKGSGNGPMVAVAAHLDTVFPEGTNVKVKRQGTLLTAPGVGDDTRSLAIILGIVRAMQRVQIQTVSDILFVGDVGEEGPGDLRGMRYLFQKGPYKDRIKMFVSIDGTGDGSDIVTGALGSRRYRVTFHGPGGHSYGAFGIVNPAYALAKAMDKISRIQVPNSPHTTYNVGVIGGGTSVNSIPGEVWMEVDLRSETTRDLDRLTDEFLRQMRLAAEEENTTRSTIQGRIRVETALIGERPSGATPATSPIVQTASEVVRRYGGRPNYVVGSTDSNIPISMNIAAITVDSGGQGGRAHSLDEWIDVERGPSLKGIKEVMALVLSLAGIQ